MSLESEIKQERFQSEYHKAVINILVTGSWLYTQHAKFLKQYDLTPEQFNVLRILRGSHPKPMMLLDIAARMIDKNSNCTRLVEKLRQKGWVTRELCATNRRQVDISITPKGLQLLKRIDNTKTPWLKMENLSKAEASQLNKVLDKLRG
ncbi:MAG: MarR family transcriptional regulator [Bacteroidota bacterium]|nr:MAG: transcriptional regulator [Bacteroidetes bacterium OLB12]GIL23823.1 MAG: MarR family transcriptional regulator [Bacteroidota bacterium]HNR75145.1 MarR family transcriptional regulator [Cyclobacteriaceae bacterium]HNU42062.1 MarR family transcriptional regulator [Cyclobacteriaceae bacterium]